MKRFKVSIVWTQRGHNITDPTGTKEHQLSTTWVVVEGRELANAIHSAQEYGTKMLTTSLNSLPAWVSFKVHIQLIVDAKIVEKDNARVHRPKR